MKTIARKLLFATLFASLFLFTLSQSPGSLIFSQASAASPAGKQSSTNSDKAKKDATQQQLKILSFSEVEIDGANVLVLMLNYPLNEKQKLNKKIFLTTEEGKKVDGGWELSSNKKELLFRHLRPDSIFNLTVNKDLLAENGATLEQNFSDKIKTLAITPMTGFSSQKQLLPSRIMKGLPVTTLNVDNIDVDFFRIKPEKLRTFLSEVKLKGELETWRSAEKLAMTDLVWSGRFDLAPERNRKQKRLIPLEKIKPVQQPGLYLAVMKQAGTYNYTNPATLFTISDIGLSLHRFASGKMVVITSSLEDGRSLHNVKLELLDSEGKLLQTTNSDDKGFAQLSALPGKASLIIATQGVQTTLLDLRRPALDLAEFPTSGPQSYNKQFFIFSPRDLYRPGETVMVNGLLRDPGGYPLATQPVTMEVVKPDGEVAQTHLWEPENGLYHKAVKLYDDAATGSWTIRISTGDEQLHQWRFNVEDFMPERMELTFTPLSPVLNQQKTYTFEAQGRYLYDAPASGNGLEGKLFLRPDREAIAQLPGYLFGDEVEQDLNRTLDEFSQKLDDQGKTTVKIESDLSGLHSPVKMILQASLLEENGRPVSRRTSQSVWTEATMPGILPKFTSRPVYNYRSGKYENKLVADSGSKAVFDIVAANMQGEKVAMDGLEVRLLRELERGYWVYDENRSWHFRHNPGSMLVEQLTLNTEAGKASRVELPVKWGKYRLEVRSPSGKTVSSVKFRAGYYRWGESTNTDSGIRPDQIRLTLDQPTIKPGERAMVNIYSPIAGKGYLLLESGNDILWSQNLDLPEGHSKISMPIDPSWQRSDLYLNALLINPTNNPADKSPKRAVGLLHLPVQDQNRRLNITIDVPHKVRPNSQVAVKIKAVRKDGTFPNKATVLLSAVDTGILNITQFKTPDPYEAFFGRKRYSVDLYDVYGDLIDGDGKAAKLRFGGDAEDELSTAGQAPPAHVEIIAQQLQPVTLDAKGEATIMLPLPDFNGELRLMTQAWSDSDFGSADQKITVAAPVIVELAKPRFLAGGDTAQLALSVTNQTETAQQLRVDFSAKGLLAMPDENSQTLVLEAGKRQIIKVKVVALPGWGEGQISASISGFKQADDTQGDNVNYQWKLGVRSAWPLETYRYSSVIAPDTTGWQVPLTETANIDAKTLQGRLTITNKPELDLARVIRELYAYPYGCLEQTTSGLYPSLYITRERLKRMGIGTSSDSERREAINKGIDRLFGMQRFNGGFGLWSKNSPEEFWLTAYVMDFLTRADEQGYSVPKDKLNKGNMRLVQYLQNGLMTGRVSSDVQAYAALVLARQQKASLSTLRQIADKFSTVEQKLPLIQLAVALKLMGDEPRYQSLMARGLSNVASESSHTAWNTRYGSPIRDKALILALLEEYRLKPETQVDLLVNLSDSLERRSYYSTQQNNALFLAEFRKEQDKTPWEVVLNETDKLTGGEGDVRKVKAEMLKKALSVINKGSQKVFARLNIYGYPKSPPKPYNNSLNISRELLDTDGKPLDVANLKNGQLVVVHLKVESSLRVRDALIEDLLPAGLELENQNLGESSASLETIVASSPELSRMYARMQAETIDHTEYRDDRFVMALTISGETDVLYLARAVTPGDYQIPPPLVESMYKPEIRARGASGSWLHIE